MNSSLLSASILVCICLLWGCKKNSQDLLSSAVVKRQNPLPECPSTPNCFLISLKYQQPPDDLLNASIEVLESMGATKISVDRKNTQINSVFTIWLFRFKDDMTIKIDKEDIASYMHIRSASRKGYSDLGVNEHRVKTFIQKLEKEIGRDNK